MKKPSVRRIAFLLATGLVFTGNILGIRVIAVEGEDPVKRETTNQPPPNVWVGYELSHDKVLVGTRTEQYGWVGAYFTKVYNVYEIKDCCVFTGNKMFGCSAGVECAK
jgi:hypothetical protein